MDPGTKKTQASDAMEFSTKKIDLLEELTAVQGVVERKITIPILAHVLLEADEGLLSLTTTDLELSLRTQCPARVKKTGAATVPAKKLLDLVRLLPDEEIRFRMQENFWVQVICERKSYRLVGLAKDNFPALPEPPPALARVPARLLADLVAQTVFAIADEENRYTLNGALFILRPEAIVAVATDGHRLALVEAEHKFNDPALREEVRVLIPKKALQEISRLVPTEEDARVEFTRDTNHIFLRFPGGRLLIARLLTGQFPNYEAVLPRENHRVIVVDSGEFAAALRRVAQLADERLQAVKLVFSADEVEISASSQEYGEASEVFSVESASNGPASKGEARDPLTIGFNVKFLLDFLGVVSGPVRIELKDEQSAAQLRPVEEESLRYRYIVMPMRI